MSTGDIVSIFLIDNGLSPMKIKDNRQLVNFFSMKLKAGTILGPHWNPRAKNDGQYSDRGHFGVTPVGRYRRRHSLESKWKQMVRSPILICPYVVPSKKKVKQDIDDVEGRGKEGRLIQVERGKIINKGVAESRRFSRMK